MYVSSATRLTSLPMFLSGWITSWVNIIVIGRNGILLYLNILLRRP